MSRNEFLRIILRESKIITKLTNASYFELSDANIIEARYQTIKGHSQLWNRADLDTSFLTMKNVQPNLESKFI